jgi:flagellar biosynthesis anti-sigma factor FlgM
VKIPEHGVPDGNVPSTGNDPEKAPLRDPHSPCDASPGADRVAFSREFQFARAELSRQPEIRMELVADLRRRLAGGAFKVDGERVAEKLLHTIDFGWPRGLAPFGEE